MNEDHDVEIWNREDVEHPENFDSPWLAVFADGQIDGFETEEAAYRFQRDWRVANSRHSMTGEKLWAD